MNQARITIEDIRPFMDYYNAHFMPLISLGLSASFDREQFNEKLTLHAEQLHGIIHRLLASKKMLNEEMAKEFFQRQMDIAQQQMFDLQNYMISTFKDHMTEFSSKFEEMKTGIVGEIQSSLNTAVYDIDSSNESKMSKALEQNKKLVTLIRNELLENKKQISLLQNTIAQKDQELQQMRIQAPLPVPAQAV